MNGARTVGQRLESTILHVHSEPLILCIDADIELEADVFVEEGEGQYTIAVLQAACMLISELTALDCQLLINFGVEDLNLHFSRFAEYIEDHLLQCFPVKLIVDLDAK